MEMTKKLLVLVAALMLANLVFADDIWIDVRSQEEWDTGHLEQALLIPHTEIAAKIAEVTGDKDASIKLYCRSGGRAGKAKAVLESMGYSNVENVGGYADAQKKVEAAN